jgi:hypothetical protein
MALFLLVTRPGPTGISRKPRFAGIFDPFVWEMCARIPGLDGWERCTKIPLSSAVTDTEKAPLCAILKTTLSTLSGTQRDSLTTPDCLESGVPCPSNTTACEI